jgi:tight adherence protein B
MKLLAVILLALALAVPAAAKVRIGGVDTSGYPELRVSVVAPQGSARPSLGENGRAVVGLRATNLGRAKSVVLAVDRSQSMTGRSLADATAAARAFVAAKSAADRVEVISFGHKALALTRFSSSTVDADAALRKLLPDTVSGTALWDAVAVAARRLVHEDQAGHVIIVVTDGHDVSSTASMETAVAAAHRARASVYPIAIPGPDFTPEPLREIAAKTGGVYHQVSSSSQLAAIYARIARVLARTWELRYATAARPGDRVRLTATVAAAGAAERTVLLTEPGPGVDTVPPSTLLPHSAWVSREAPLVVSGAVGLLILLASAFWFTSRSGMWLRSRLDPHLANAQPGARRGPRRERRALRKRLLAATDRALENVRQFKALQHMLERADLPLRAAELLYICLGSGVVFGLLAAPTGLPAFLILAFTGVGAALPVLFVSFKARKRIRAFDQQLADLLITIAASLKAGHSFRHAIQSVVDEGAEPASKEFKRVLTETRLGRPMDDALTDMSFRVGSKDLTFVITAVTIQRQIGGSLAGLFDMVAETIRQRQQFARKIRGLTAMGRMSAYVLTGLPFFIAVAVTALNPSYMSPLYNTSTGHMLVGSGLVMIAFGSLVLKKIVSFRG